MDRPTEQVIVHCTHSDESSQDQTVLMRQSNESPNVCNALSSQGCLRSVTCPVVIDSVLDTTQPSINQYQIVVNCNASIQRVTPLQWVFEPARHFPSGRPGRCRGGSGRCRVGLGPVAMIGMWTLPLAWTEGPGPDGPLCKYSNHVTVHST